MFRAEQSRAEQSRAEQSRAEQSRAEQTIRLGNVYDDEKFTGGNYGGHVWDANGIAPTLKTGSSASQQFVVEIKKMDEVLIKQATKTGTIPCAVPGICDLAYPTSKTRRGRVIDGGMTCPTLNLDYVPDVLEEWTWELDGEIYLIRIRKLTPRETWRLQGYTDEDFNKAEQVNSNSRLYAQSGNAICKSVLMAIFSQMGIQGLPRWNDLTDEERYRLIDEGREVSQG